MKENLIFLIKNGNYVKIKNSKHQTYKFWHGGKPMFCGCGHRINIWSI